MNTMFFDGPTFTLTVPTNWMISATPQFQAVFTSPETDAGVKANLLIALRPVEDNVTVYGVSEVARQTQEKEYPSYEVLLEEELQENGSEGFHRVYRWHNEEKDLGVVQHQAFYILGNRLYSLTGTRAETAENAEAIDEIFETMIQSFSFKAMGDED